MLKYLVLVLIALGIYWLLRNRSAAAQKPDVATRPEHQERMLTCRQCGVRFPESECISADGRHYCCEEHRRAGES